MEQAAAAYDVAPGGRAMMRREAAAATESMGSGVYIVWRTRRPAVGGSDDCARVGGASRCFCGHSFSDHAALNRADPRAPLCGACRCPRFEFVPSRPEEVGMWWLPRRQGFDVRTWRAPCSCKHGHDQHDPKTRRCNSCACGYFRSQYACLGCDGAQEDHDTVFELESERQSAGRPVREAFAPLAGASSELKLHAFSRPGAPHQPPLAAAESLKQQFERSAISAACTSLEQQFERGAISTAEYHRRLLSAAPGDEPDASAVGTNPTRPPPYARPPPTMREARMQLGDGRAASVVTNIGAPQPVPGMDWSRPWQPAGRPSAGRSSPAPAPGRSAAHDRARIEGKSKRSAYQ